MCTKFRRRKRCLGAFSIEAEARPDDANITVNAGCLEAGNKITALNLGLI